MVNVVSGRTTYIEFPNIANIGPLRGSQFKTRPPCCKVGFIRWPVFSSPFLLIRFVALFIKTIAITLWIYVIWVSVAIESSKVLWTVPQ